MCNHNQTAADLGRYKLSVDDWSNVVTICQFLEKPAIITTKMGGQKYVTISKALRYEANDHSLQ
jgi:hypothetical protein